MKKLQKNPETGFLETKRSFPSKNIRTYQTFTAEKKIQFLNLSRDFITATKMMPNFAEICEELNVRINNLYEQLAADPEFKKEYKDILKSLSAHYTSKLAQKAEKDSGVIANLALLKYFETGSFVDRLNVKQTVDFSMNQKVYDAIKVDIDPEIPHIQTMPSQKLGSYEVVDTQPVVSAKNIDNKH